MYSPSVPHQNEPLPSPIISNGDYLLSTINLREPQYALPGAAYPPSLIVSDDDYLLSAINLSEPQPWSPSTVRLA